MKSGLLYFAGQCRREGLIRVREPQLLMNAALFFLMVSVFFPITLPPELALLHDIAPGLIWMTTLFAILLSSERLFQDDYEEGIIEQWVIDKAGLIAIISAKLLVHWFAIILPLILFCPLLAFLYHLSVQETAVLMLSLLLGTPAITSLCGLAAAFSTGTQQRGMFMALILLPLTLPIMIFGSGALVACMQQTPVSGGLALLAAVSLLMVGTLPFAIAAVIGMSTES